MEKSPYDPSNQNRNVVTPSPKFKVLIAVHDFYDAPHAFGETLYPDFYLWLTELEELSKLTNYDWYIKTHPSLRGNGAKVIGDFVQHSSTIKLIHAETNHLTLISEGIDAVLTVYGTIAMEYAALGKLVVNASINHPNSRYHFSVSPTSIQEYRQIILRLDKLENCVDLEEVYEYHFMKNIFSLQSWVFKDYGKLLSEMGSYEMSYSKSIYSYYLNTTNKYDNHRLVNAVKNFINSADLRIGRTHFKPELPIL
jgi:hypothetical protein